MKNKRLNSTGNKRKHLFSSNIHAHSKKYAFISELKGPLMKRTATTLILMCSLQSINRGKRLEPMRQRYLVKTSYNMLENCLQMLHSHPNSVYNQVQNKNLNVIDIDI